MEDLEQLEENEDLSNLDKETFLPEYNQLIKDEDYINLIENCKKEAETRQKEVFNLYTNTRK